MKRIMLIIFVIILIMGCSTMPQYKTIKETDEVSSTITIDIGKAIIVGCTVYYFGSEMEWY